MPHPFCPSIHGVFMAPLHPAPDAPSPRVLPAGEDRMARRWGSAGG